MKRLALALVLVAAVAANAALTWNVQDYRSPIANPAGAANDGYTTQMVSDGTNLYFYQGRTGQMFKSATGQAGTWTEVAGANTIPTWTNAAEQYGNAMTYVAGGKLAISRIRIDGLGLPNPWDEARMGVYDIATNAWTYADTGATEAGSSFMCGGLFSIGSVVYGHQHAAGGQTMIRLDLNAPGPIPQQRTGFSGLSYVDTAGNPTTTRWFSRAVMSAIGADGMVYSMKHDRYGGLTAGDQLWKWDPTQYTPGGDTPATVLAPLPFQVGEGDGMLSLPAGWAGEVGAQGGLFILRGRGDMEAPGNFTEGRGNATADYAIYDIATNTYTLGVLPGLDEGNMLNGAGASVAFHNGQVYVKIGHNDLTGTNGVNDLIYVVPEPTALALLGLGALLLRRR